MKSLLLLCISSIFLTGCVCLNPEHHKSVPPSVQTQKVVESLKNIRTSLDEAGEENASVDQKLTRAISLAERLDVLLEQLEAMFTQGKSTIKPQ